MTTGLRSLALPLFALAALVVYGAAVLVTGQIATARDPGLVAAAVATDLVLLVPLLYFALVVRLRRRPAVTLAPVVLLSLIGAYWVLPEAHEGVLEWFEVGVVLVEAAALTWAGLRLRAVAWAFRASGETDLLARLRESLAAAFGPGVFAEAAAAEAAVPPYVLGRGREARTEATFGYRGRSGYGAVFAALVLVGGVELALGHFLLLRYVGETAALVHLALSSYGALWLTADFRAMHARPIRLDARGLRVACGLRWTAEVPLTLIEEVRRLERGSYAGAEGFVDLTPLARARYAVVLREPVRVRGPFGVTREARRLGLDVDDRERFEARLAALVGAA